MHLNRSILKLNTLNIDANGVVFFNTHNVSLVFKISNFNNYVKLSCRILYNEVRSIKKLKEIDNVINRLDPKYKSDWAFNILWSRVGLANKSCDNHKNAYQMIFVSDKASQNYVIFNYVKLDSKQLPTMHVGYNLEDRVYYFTQALKLKKVYQLVNWSNINLTGVWVFKIKSPNSSFSKFNSKIFYMVLHTLFCLIFSK